MVNVFNGGNLPIIKSQEKNAGIVRSSIIISRTDLVEESESDAIKFGIIKFLKEIGSILNIVDIGNYKLGNQPYGSADWYQEQAKTSTNKGLGEQVNGDKIFQLLLTEPYQKNSPHYDFMIVDKDMRINDPNNNFVFGIGGYPNNVLSTRRFKNYIKDVSLRYMSFSIAAAHELGHNFDLTNRTFNTGKEGYHLGHCMGKSGSCLMEQSNVGNKTIETITRDIFDRQNWLCGDCKEEIAFRISKIRELGINI
ncbi:MAG: hypothetical protein PHH98_02265 [Candidatus Gracilibacteria bacterium]|nr:hypothetical protein [Candidatus Gracilibacteria bacterium]